MNDTNTDAPALVRRRRRIARQQREKTPEPISKIGGIRPEYSDEESSSTTNTTTTEHERRILLEQNDNQRTKSKRGSTSSGNGTHGSNAAYRKKILNRRDRSNKTAAHELIRSQSQPRQLQPDPISDDEKTGNDSGKQVIRFLRQAKRSLSIPRRKKDAACGTSPIRQNDEVIRRYAKVPTAKAEPKVNNTLAENEDQKRISKLEQNLRRFEDDRRRFILEKEKFEKERRQMEQVRFQRLIEFERKRNNSIQQRDRERLAVEAAAIALAEIENQRLMLRNRRSNSKSRDNSRSGNSETRYADDYVSSTASTISSRAADFDDEIGIREVSQMNGEHSNINGSTFELTEPHEDPIIESSTKMELKQSWLSRLVFGKRESICVRIVEKKSYRHLIVDDGGPISVKRILTIEAPLVWQQMIEDHSNDWAIMMRVRNRCIAHLVLLSILVGMGGLIFRFIEGAFENFYKCGVRRVKREFIDQLWDSSHDMREDDWKDLARNKLRGFEEELHNAHEAGFRSYSGLNVWTFINGVVFCVTVVTTIGYGHISPATTTGRAITIIYSIIGIPLFLILLADFGKLFTRGIKFVWAYVRRLYYTGSLRRMRKQAQVQEMLRGIEMAYEIATFRRPSMMMKQSDLERAQTATPNSSNVAATGQSETPSTPIPSEIEIDDEFNLPISVALIILITYILCGAAFYSISEGWSFFDACYFVFISMSTIGFGDFVPHHPIRMMCSIIYLIFGLALTSMCINVVQVKLSDSFRQASAKISATIGLTLAEEEARSSQNLTPVPENVSVHSYGKKNDTFKTNPEMSVYDNAEMHDSQMITKPDGAPSFSTQKSPDQLAPPTGPHDKIKSIKNNTDYNNKQTRK